MPSDKARAKDNRGDEHTQKSQSSEEGKKMAGKQGTGHGDVEEPDLFGQPKLFTPDGMPLDPLRHVVVGDYSSLPPKIPRGDPGITYIDVETPESSRAWSGTTYHGSSTDDKSHRAGSQVGPQDRSRSRIRTRPSSFFDSDVEDDLRISAKPAHLSPVEKRGLKTVQFRPPYERERPDSLNLGTYNPLETARVRESERMPTVLHPGRANFDRKFISQYRGVPDHIQVETQLLISNKIQSYISSNLDEGDSIWDAVVLTGNPRVLWATTCGEYIEKTWPKHAEKIRKMLQKIVSAQETEFKEEVVGQDYLKNDISVKTKLNSNQIELRPELIVLLNAIIEEQVVLIQALTWFLGVFHSDFDGTVGVGAQVMAVQRDKVIDYKIEVDFLRPVMAEDIPDSCWLPLVPCTPMALDFLPPRRNAAMRGMEMSFDLMCYLCGLEYEVVENNGLVLFGNSSLVYPVHFVDDSVQWHFEPIDPASNNYGRIVGQRLNVKDVEELIKKPRHFLGLWSDPEITLGTDRTDFSKIAWSRANEQKTETLRDGSVIGGTIGMPRVLSITWSQTYKVFRNRKSVHLSNFDSKMHGLINTPVLLYSVTEQRAWLVSYLSLLFFISRARAYFQRGLGFYIPPCAAAADGGQAALDVIRRCKNQPLKQAAPNEVLDEEELTYKIKDYIDEVWAALETAKRESFRTRTIFRTQIVGYEMADITNMKPSLRMKRVSLPSFSHGWTPLLDEVELALFYEGIFDPIVPSAELLSRNSKSQCQQTTWNRVPIGFNILTASVPCLNSISERIPGTSNLRQLTTDYVWHNPGPTGIFSFCDKASRHVCVRLQELHADDWTTVNKPESPRAELLVQHRTGAVVFKYKHDMFTIQERLDEAQKVRRASYNNNLGDLPHAELAPVFTHHRADSGYDSASLGAGLSTRVTSSPAKVPHLVSPSSPGFPTVIVSPDSEAGELISSLDRLGLSDVRDDVVTETALQPIIGEPEEVASQELAPLSPALQTREFQRLPKPSRSEHKTHRSTERRPVERSERSSRNPATSPHSPRPRAAGKGSRGPQAAS